MSGQLHETISPNFRGMVLLFSIFQQIGSYCIDKANHIEYHLEYSYNAPSYQAQDG